jgi:hypothetical protein
MDDIGDGSALAAILQSDQLIQAIQQELSNVYPDKVIPTNTIRRILYTAMLRQNLRGEMLAPSTLFIPPQTNNLPLEREETVYDLLWYDKVYSALGG